MQALDWGDGKLFYEIHANACRFSACNGRVIGDFIL